MVGVVRNLTGTFVTEKGGKGSGHKGHVGRPGMVGGSLPGVGGAALPPVPSNLGSDLSYKPTSTIREYAHNVAREDVERIAEYYDITEDEAIQKVAAQLDEDLANPIAIRTSLGSAEAILESGKFKTQFETGTTGGTFSPSERLEAESNGLGASPNMPIRERPVYGYFKTKEHGAHDYGYIEFVLKDHIKARSTYTVGDSLDGFGEGIQVGGTSSNHIEAWDYMANTYAKSGVSAVSYIEAQIQGGVKLADVSRIIIHSSQELVDERHGDLLALAKGKGITIEVDAISL